MKVKVYRAVIRKAGYPADHSVWKLFRKGKKTAVARVAERWIYRGKLVITLWLPDGNGTTILASQCMRVK